MLYQYNSILVLIFFSHKDLCYGISAAGETESGKMATMCVYGGGVGSAFSH